MAKRKQSIKSTKKTTENKSSFFAFLKTRQTQTILGTFLILFSVFICIAFISFFFNWQEDQSTLTELSNKAVKSKNLLGKIGANLSHFFIYKSFGLGAFIMAFQVFLTGAYILLKKKLSKIIISWNWSLIAMLWVSVTLGFLHKKYAILSGVVGFEINDYLQTFIGKTGLFILLGFLFIVYLVLRYKVTFDKYIENLKKKREALKTENSIETNEASANINSESDVEESQTISLDTTKKEKSEFEKTLENLKPTIAKHSDVSSPKEEITLKVEKELEPVLKTVAPKEEEKEVEIDVEETKEEELSTENLSNQLVKDFGEFDPTLELGNYKFQY